MNKTKLVILDLDGTIIVESEFYKKVYSATLNEAIKENSDESGTQVLEECRKKYSGKGELALFMLNIPFEKWAEKLENASLDLIKPCPMLAEKIRKLNARKVLYTGSPTKMAIKMINKVGLSNKDFDLIIGWENPEFMPTKWTCSPKVFKFIFEKFPGIKLENAWSVGDDWDTDLKPAKSIGMKTAQIRKTDGSPLLRFEKLEQFIGYIAPN